MTVCTRARANLCACVRAGHLFVVFSTRVFASACLRVFVYELNWRAGKGLEPLTGRASPAQTAKCLEPLA